MESPSSASQKHKVVGLLGKGSYATVYLARHRHTNDLIALKTARLEKSSTLVKENRILEYFRNCSEIVHSYGAESTVEDGHEFYNLLLEYAPAGTLFDLMQRSGGCVPDEIDVRLYTWMVLNGLSSIHAKGVVHCDIKPDNILVFPTEHDGIYQLKISDFGLAKELSEAATDGDENRGTTAYMSPEAVAPRGEIVTALDIWSLGCVVVEMITGRDAWPCLASVTIVHLMVTREKTPKIPENMPETGKDFLSKCFERDPRKRWSAQMLLDHPYVSGG